MRMSTHAVLIRLSIDGERYVIHGSIGEHFAPGLALQCGWNFFECYLNWRERENSRCQGNQIREHEVHSILKPSTKG